MKSLDTNIVIRALAEDDDEQSPAAKSVFTSDVYIGDGVFMEAEWFLRARYKWSRDRINEAFEQLSTLNTVSVRDLDAHQRHRGGADLADMLHLVASKGSCFVTFDAKLAAQAGPATPLPVETLA